MQMFLFKYKCFDSNANSSANTLHKTTLHLNANANATFSHASAFVFEPMRALYTEIILIAIGICFKDGILAKY